ncbi:DEAD/DEAH box helicase [Conexibacter sp. W3-3-2]|nr:DEAD/DEAH box helicase [Conexibacter sp. W3-3-2]MTD43821.1 DEAD/DEAH box helicase [Conexibacter sp. W3-3-2]
MQAQTIPPLLEGRDLLGQAATGTGKTAAFALPALERLAASGTEDKAPRVLVLAPTRELATQVSEAMHKYGRGIGARVLPIYGGQPIVRQLRALSGGVDVVVATPGRALDHIGRGTLDLSRLHTVVLDEADEMLDMGFAEDIESILEAAPADRQTVLFSATMPPRIARMVKKHLTDPVHIEVKRAATPEGEAPKVRQAAYVVHRPHKAAALGRILDLEVPTAAIVFCRTRAEVDALTETLNGRGYRAEALHGGLSQEQRSKVLQRLRAGTTELLVATDVAARGLDIDTLTHVVNYDVPASPETYVHRIGRVGRAGREGVAITLAQPREHRMLKTIEKITRQPVKIEKVPTIADLHARRLELTRAALQESLLQEDDLERFRVVVETLADEFDVMQVAMAAVRLAHQAQAGVDEDDEEEIPQASLDRGPKPDRDRGPARPGAGGGKPGGGRRLDAEGPTTRIFIGAGRSAGIRPQDLVGAITGESSLTGRQIGAIEITDRFSLVELPENRADEVIAAMRSSTIKGRKATVRREKFDRKRR